MTSTTCTSNNSSVSNISNKCNKIIEDVVVVIAINVSQEAVVTILGSRSTTFTQKPKSSVFPAPISNFFSFFFWGGGVHLPKS